MDNEKLIAGLKEMLEAGELSQEAHDKIIALLTAEEPKEEEKTEADKEAEEKELAEQLYGMKFN